MVSTKSFLLHNLKTLPIVLIVFTIFAVGATENFQVANAQDGYFSASGKLLQFELHPGETSVQEWRITNSFNHTINIEVYAEGEGSELFVFEELHVIPAKSSVYPEIFVIVPDDHPTDIEYHPSLFALMRGEAPTDLEGNLISGAIVSVQAKNLPVIKIGDNPIFTPQVVEKVNELPTPPVVKNTPVEIEEVPEETLEEKLERIAQANEANRVPEVVVDDVWEESFEEEAVQDYVPEPMDAEPVAVQEVKAECGFIDWLLSLFGFGTCE